ncbi:hypothetical protein EVAR_33493_1 [Eumeta japonica]|uniref:Uncharacterized protein n=1 Tax=Eumeta variegata TaxID=151549 RepID=A0A4C1WEF7_EUMVA|nr:hypothetical protein EVAR_33493_1 [Eumeta japonica]
MLERAEFGKELVVSRTLKNSRSFDVKNHRLLFWTGARYFGRLHRLGKHLTPEPKKVVETGIERGASSKPLHPTRSVQGVTASPCFRPAAVPLDGRSCCEIDPFHGPLRPRPRLALVFE